MKKDQTHSNKVKVIMYAEAIKRRVIKDDVIVACYYRIKAFLIKARRKYLQRKAENKFKVTWDKLSI